MRVRALVIAAVAALFVGISFPVASSAAVSGDDICPGQAQPASMGDSIAVAVDFPYSPATAPQRYYEGAILRPTDTTTYPGKRPSVVLQPGLGQDKCTLWWAAQYLAGHGFVATVHDTPDPGLEEDPDFPYVVDWAQVAIDGDAAVVDFLKTDPTASNYADVDHLGFGGYDEGTIVASVIDTELLGTEGTNLGIDAIVSFNNLRSRLTGDLSGNGLQCFGEPQGFFIPVSPALGFAEDEPCDGLPEVFEPDIKLGGWRTWKSYGFPTMEVVLRGVEHEDFADDNGGETFWKDAGHYSTAWFRRWLGPDPSQNQVLLSPILNGRPTSDALSTTFQSAVFLPPATDTDDFTCELGGACLKPAPDPDPDPDPDPNPKPHPEPGPPDIRSSLVFWLRPRSPGQTFVVRVTYRNVGESAALDTRDCLKAKNAKPLGRRCRTIIRIAPGARLVQNYRFRIKRSAKPGQWVKAIVVTKTPGQPRSTAWVKFRVSPRRP